VDFADLALIALIGTVGPLLATRRAWHLPVTLGELLAGAVLGRTGFLVLHPDDETFTFLAQIGFALVMFVAGSHVPMRERSLRPALRFGVLRAVAVALLSVLVGFALAAGFGTGNGAVYAVLLASSSAALALPIIDSLQLGGNQVLALISQIAIADAACIVALPLVIDKAHAGRAALGATAVIATSVVLYFVLARFEANGQRKRLHALSKRHRFALELRINLFILFALSALAVATHVSVMLAGFSLGLVVAAIGQPRRLARQLFGLAEGFFGPLFFVWLGASVDIRALGTHPSFIALGVLLGVGAVVTHGLMRATGQPIPLAVLAAGQLGVPVGAAALGEQLHLLAPGEAAALLLGALVTIAAVAVAGARAARTQQAQPSRESPDARRT